jgi:hypothetical protein
MPGKKPASVTPSRNRSTMSIAGLATNVIAVATSPQVMSHIEHLAALIDERRTSAN